MLTRAEIMDILATSQRQVITFFQELNSEDLERSVTESDVPGAHPWCAKDHLAHLAKSERNIQRLLRNVLAGEPQDVVLRLQYPEGMPMPKVLGDLSALSPEEEERLIVAIANINQTYVDKHRNDSLETLITDYMVARQDTVNLLQQFTDNQLVAPVPTVGGEQTAGGLFAGRAEHAREHIISIEEGFSHGA